MFQRRLATLWMAASLAMPAFADIGADPSCQGDPDLIVGHVVAKAGTVQAQRPGEDLRSLSCNDVIHACDTIITSPSSRVGVLTGNVYAQIDTDSRLQIGTAGDQPSLMLLSGAMRVIDARGADAVAIPLSTPHLTTHVQRTDTELWVTDAGSTRLCNHVDSMQVKGQMGGDSLGVEAGCVESGGHGVSMQAPVGPTLHVQDTPSCEVAIAGMFTPLDVAAPQFGFDVFPTVTAADVFHRGACEASNCPNRVTPIPTPPPPRRTPPPRPKRIRVVDPGPGTGCGGAGFGCGGGEAQ